MQQIRPLACIAFAVWPCAARAHALECAEFPAWQWEPWALVCLAPASIGYALGRLRLRREGREPIALGPLQATAFVAGIAALLVALESPLDRLSEQLFSAHMTQHVLLMLVAPPLLILGRPVHVWLWAFARGQRRWIGQLWLRSGPVRGIVQALCRPIPAWLACAGALWFWHLPGPYQWALAHPAVHALEHASFFLTSLAFWNAALDERASGVGPGTSFLLVATFAVQNGLLGAILTFAARPLYDAHAHSSQHWNLTPLQDQQLSGLIMWIPAGTIHLLVMSVLFIRWLQIDERRADRIRL